MAAYDKAISAAVVTAPMPETTLTGAQTVTVSTSVVKSGAGLTVPAGATHCYVSVETNPVRFWNSGDTPSATFGHQLDAGAGPIELAVASLQMIRAGASDATVQVSYHKYP